MATPAQRPVHPQRTIVTDSTMFRAGGDQTRWSDSNGCARFWSTERARLTRSECDEGEPSVGWRVMLGEEQVRHRRQPDHER